MVYNDLTSLEHLFSHCTYDYVFHLAAQSYPKTSFTAPNDTYQTNIVGTNNIMLMCHRHCPGATIHNCSSSEVFGRVPADLVPINEETPSPCISLCNF